ncbi:MAG: hypothetical protein LBR24_04225 [Methanobrevibacter sp.]|jgi:hypothetical protein|nr:hypothetical protein [Methanobrevibacter sp.]
MFTIKKHFLDSNILLRSIFPSEEINIFKSYFQEDFNRLISFRVHTECFNVIKRLRRISLSFLYHFKKNIIKNHNPINAEKTIISIKNNFVKDYENFAYSKGLNQARFNGIVNDFVKDYYDELYQDLINNSTLYTDKLIRKTNENYIIYSENLVRIIETLNIGKFYNEKENVSLEESLYGIGIHKADQLILLDCYYFSMNYPKLIAFITNDREINREKKKIHALLDISVFNPTDYF